MREPREAERIAPFLKELQEAWELYPDMRFGQLVVNIAGAGVATMYHFEEDSWLHLIRSYKKNMAAGLAAAQATAAKEEDSAVQGP